MKKIEFDFTKSNVKEEIDLTHWTFAKTYKDFAPHQYITRKQNPELCYMFDKLMETSGSKEKFKWKGGYKIYKYVYTGKYKYWFTNQGFVLNRCPKKQKNAKNYKGE